MNITIKTEWLEAAKTLQDPFAFIEALASYIATGITPDLDVDAKGIFIMAKAEIDKKAAHRQATKKWREKPANDITANHSDITVNHSKSQDFQKENPPCTPYKENTKKSTTKVVPKESGLSFEQLIPEPLKTIEFEIAWNQWCRYRKEVKKSITKSTAERQLQTLGRYPPGIAVMAIDESIKNGWTGLFPEKITIRLPATKTRDYTKL